MPSIIARLIVSLVVMLAGPVLFFIIFFTWYELVGYRQHSEAILGSMLIAAVFEVAAWVLVWRASVSWTGLRVGGTAAVAFGTALGATVVGLLLAISTGEEAVGMLCGGMVWGLAWFGLTPLVWKETRAERDGRLRAQGTDALPCPTCGYNLTGLREATCPECGARYTLDQLFTSVREEAAPMERV